MLDTLGLGGDGDEIHAIDDVEARFGVRLDYRDAYNWNTAGDVFSALLREVPADMDREAAWPEFAEAISQETDVDPDRVAPATRLLGDPVNVQIIRGLKNLFVRRS